MREERDVVIIGGAFSGSSLALLLRRDFPQLRVLVVERSEEFDRKVGEATTEVAGDFLHRRLGLTSYLANHHIAKQGLRLWFTDGSETPFEECREVGAKFQVRLPSFQVDRSQLDEQLLKLAGDAGSEIWREARVKAVDLEGSTVDVETSGGDRRLVAARWIVDASGRAAMLARQTGNFRKLEEHPTNAIWARFRGVGDLDGDDLRRRFPEYGQSALASRGAATNHLTGYGWWCWIIPLKGGDVSVGLVYDSRLFSPPEGASLIDRLRAHLDAHPVGRELFGRAEPIEGDVRAYSGLPYYSEQIAGTNWQLVGDAAGFMDPLYSPGLDYCSFTVRCALGRIAAELRGEAIDLRKLNSRFRQSYDTWFRGLYKDKYYYLGDAELMSAAYWMDIALFYLGPVRELAVAPEEDLDCLPFNGPVDSMVGRFMAFYNSRLARLAQVRKAAGCYGQRNTGKRELGDGFVPDVRVLRVLLQGVVRWLGAEVHAWSLLGKSAETTGQTQSTVPETAVSA